MQSLTKASFLFTEDEIRAPEVSDEVLISGGALIHCP